MDIGQLQAELRANGLSPIGAKDVLVERLEVCAQLLARGLDASGDDNAVLIARLENATSAGGQMFARKRHKTLSSELEALCDEQRSAEAEATAVVSAKRDAARASDEATLDELRAAHEAAAKKHHDEIELQQGKLRALAKELAMASTPLERKLKTMDASFLEQQEKAKSDVAAIFASRRQQLDDSIAGTQMIFAVPCVRCKEMVINLKKCGSCDTEVCEDCCRMCFECNNCCKLCVEFCRCGGDCEGSGCAADDDGENGEGSGCCQNCIEEACDYCECICAHDVQSISGFHDRRDKHACENCREHHDFSNEGDY